MPSRISKWWLIAALIVFPLIYSSRATDILTVSWVRWCLLALAAVAWMLGCVGALRSRRRARVFSVAGLALLLFGIFAPVERPYGAVLAVLGGAVVVMANLIESRLHRAA